MNKLAPVNKPIIVGSVSGVFGVEGWVKVFSHTEPRNNILQYNPWMIKTQKGWQTVSLIKGRTQGKTIVAQLETVSDRDKAFALIGCEIGIQEHQLKKLAENEFYWRELEGLSVIDTLGNSLGKVDYMMATGANDVIVVKKDLSDLSSDKEKEILIPYLVGSVVKRVSLEESLIEVDWSETFDEN